MWTLLEARQRVCQSKLPHVSASCWRPYESLSEIWIVPLSLTGRCTIAWTKLRIILLGLYMGFGMHHGSDKHLSCDNGTNLAFTYGSHC
jgi:hypothetical protein